MSVDLEFKTIKARFAPVQEDDLASVAASLVGHTMTFQYAGIGGDDEPYPGERRWMCKEMDWYWVPECDLQEIEVTA